nr:helicase-related protein [Desulfobacteraceae bacterium]
FSTTDKALQIAISVDMLDTGIDVPDVVNLVFFKIVRSSTKFFQMIGRGTRLRTGLFGPELDKEFFYIFDYCGNLEYFGENPEGIAGSAQEPLSTRLFKLRLQLVEELKVLQIDPPDLKQAAEDVSVFGDVFLPAHPVLLSQLQKETIDILHHEVTAMNVDNFIIRPKRKHVERFKDAAQWESLDAEKLSVLFHHIAGLPAELDKEDITAKLFDLTCLKLQLSLISKSAAFAGLQQKVMDMAANLEEKETIPMVKAQMAFIQVVQTDEYWQDITLPMLERLRKNLRDLITFVEKEIRKPVFSALQDEMGEGQSIENKGFNVGVNIIQYRKKVEQFIRENDDHITINKLRFNKALTSSDLAELERFLFESGEIQGRDQFEAVFGKQESLSVFIRSLVGLDREAAKKAFSKFLDDIRFNTSQIRFVEMIIDHLTQKGVMDAGLLYEQPFTGIHYEGLDGVFPGAAADEIVHIIEMLNANADVTAAA